MPQKTLDRDLVSVIRQITDRFITSREGTPVHVAKTRLGKKHNLLEEAARDRYLQAIGPYYFPCFRALDFEDDSSRSSVEQCTALVLKGLRAIYERDGERMCTRDDIVQVWKSTDPTASPECVSVGMFFAIDFSSYVQLWGASPEGGTMLLNLQTSARLLEFDNLVSAWKQELENRASASVLATAPAGQSAQTGSMLHVFETTGETYTLEGIVGEGGTARVFRVTDSEGKHWALKCLRPEQTNATRTKRFLNELEFCRRSSHPNVIHVIDHGFATQGGKKCPFYVMPLYPSTLRKLLIDGIPLERKMRCFSDILDGVEAAHLLGVWHRDLKPENILYDPTQDRFLVSDFGIAAFTSAQMYTTVETTPAERLANFQYAAPEQRRPGRTVDKRADVFALGLMLNEMFTGHVLQGEGYVQIGQVAPEFAYLDPLVEQMVQQSPDNRPGSISEVKRTLIARGNEFVSQQKLDALRQTVVPSGTIIDPLIQIPVQVEDVDIRGSTLVAILNQAPSPHWIRAFVHPRAMTYIAGTEPANWRFNGNEATVSLGHLEGQAKQVLNNFKDYVRGANTTYKELVENALRQQEESERRALAQKIAEEERRQRILRNLRT